jgi:hypothetical protein
MKNPCLSGLNLRVTTMPGNRDKEFSEVIQLKNMAYAD